MDRLMDGKVNTWIDGQRDRLLAVLDLPVDAYLVDGKERMLGFKERRNATPQSFHPSLSETHLPGHLLSSAMVT